MLKNPIDIYVKTLLINYEDTLQVGIKYDVEITMNLYFIKSRKKLTINTNFLIRNGLRIYI